ncbi:hypothetical protein QUA33_24765 [Microcoleus sp. Pol14D4]|uniref:hypothetical protein n=1 Tax=Microcoleus sp. Pol14D4 TaxID=3055400 RepID=UPI002FCEAE11
MRIILPLRKESASVDESRLKQRFGGLWIETHRLLRRRSPKLMWVMTKPVVYRNATSEQQQQ